MNRKQLSVICAGLAFAAWACPVSQILAQEKEPTPAEVAAQEKTYNRTDTRVYDIRDLLVNWRDYRADSSLIPPTRVGERRRLAESGSRATTRRSIIEPQTRDDLVEAITTLIKETVDPDSWRDNGGTVGAIRELQGVLIVTQNMANQESLKEILRQLRETTARMVTIQAHWMFLSPADLKAVSKPFDRDQTLTVIDMAAVEKLKTPPTMLAGQVTCFNSQTVSITSGRARTVITEQVPVVGNDTVGYQATAELVQGGMVLEVTPVLSPDGSRVMLDVQSVASDWDEPGSKPATRPTVATPAVQTIPEIDRIAMNVQQLRTSVVLPMDQPIVVGGMSFEPKSDAKMNLRLYLVIEAHGTPEPKALEDHEKAEKAKP